MPTETTPNGNDRTLLHRLKLEAELRAIQAQTHEARKADIKELEELAQRQQAQIEELTQDRDRLAAELAGKRVIEEAEYARLKSAEHHLSRLLQRVNRGPFGLVARRRAGFRAMTEQWPEVHS